MKAWRQELGLPEQPLGAAIDLDACLQAVGHQTVEIGDLCVAAPELVVERQDLDDEAGTKSEGRGSAAGNRGRGSACQEDFAFERTRSIGGANGSRSCRPSVEAPRGVTSSNRPPGTERLSNVRCSASAAPDVGTITATSKRGRSRRKWR